MEPPSVGLDLLDTFLNSCMFFHMPFSTETNLVLQKSTQHSRKYHFFYFKSVFRDKLQLLMLWLSEAAMLGHVCYFCNGCENKVPQGIKNLASCSC